MAFQGTLETFYLSSLLQLLCNDKKTGVLRVNDGRDLVTVTIQDGTIIHASSTMQKEQLGALLRSRGVIGSDELAGFLQTARKKNQKLGKVIVDAGRIKPDELQGFIKLQVENILYTLFLWQKGTFEYEDCAVSLENDIFTALDTMEVVLEASRRVDEMSVLMRQVPDAAQSMQLSEHGRTASREMLHPDEKAVLELIDGERTIKQIIEESGYDIFTVYKVLYALISSGFVQSGNQAEHDMEVQLETQLSQPPSQGTGQLYILAPGSSAALLPKSEQRERAALSPDAAPPAAQPAGVPTVLTEAVHHKVQHMEQSELILEPPPPKEVKKIQIGPLPTIPAREESAAVPEQEEAAPEGKILGMYPKHAAMSGAVVFLLLVAAASLYFINTASYLKNRVPPPATPRESRPALPGSEQEKPSPDESAVQMPVQKEQPLQEDSTDHFTADMASYQDPNAFFFVNLPQGYTVQETAGGNKTDVLIIYPPNIRLKISARRRTTPWNAETEMYNTIALLQQSHDGLAAANIDTYSLCELGGGSGYEIAAAAYRGSIFCKVQVYCLTGYKKKVSIEIVCQSCRNPQIEKFFNRIKEAISKTFLLYP